MMQNENVTIQYEWSQTARCAFNPLNDEEQLQTQIPIRSTLRMKNKCVIMNSLQLSIRLVVKINMKTYQ